MASIKFNLKTDTKKLDGMIKNVSKINASFVKVGVLSGKAGRNSGADKSGLSNVEIGAKHEFGSVTDGIPMRSFIEMPLKAKRKNLEKGISKDVIIKPLLDGNIKKSLSLIGVLAENIIQSAFESGGFGRWKKLSEFTISKKGSSAILIDTAQLRKSISSKVMSK